MQRNPQCPPAAPIIRATACVFMPPARAERPEPCLSMADSTLAMYLLTSAAAYPGGPPGLDQAQGMLPSHTRAPGAAEPDVWHDDDVTSLCPGRRLGCCPTRLATSQTRDGTMQLRAPEALSDLAIPLGKPVAGELWLPGGSSSPGRCFPAKSLFRWEL